MLHPLVRPSLAPYGFSFVNRNRLEYRSALAADWVNAEHKMAKFWERHHRLDAKHPLPIETIIHDIMPAQAQANRLFQGEFEFRGLPYLGRDIALLSSIMYWFGTNVGSCFLEKVPDHVRWNSHWPHIPELRPRAAHHPEREFLEKFRREMHRRDMVAFWAHQCGERCRPRASFLPEHSYDLRIVSARDWQVAEALMRWLGHSEGRAFIASWLAHLVRARVAADARRLHRFRTRSIAA